MYINIKYEGAIYKDEKWLVIERSAKEQHAGGTLSLVGGQVEQDEAVIGVLEQTLKREIYEEVGADVMRKSKRCIYG